VVISTGRRKKFPIDKKWLRLQCDSSSWLRRKLGLNKLGVHYLLPYRFHLLKATLQPCCGLLRAGTY